MVGVFWLTFQDDLSHYLAEIARRGPLMNSQRRLQRKFSATLPRSDPELSFDCERPVLLAVDAPRAVSCGHNSVAIIDADGGLWMTGAKELPEQSLADGAHNDDGLPARVPITAPVRAVSCGSYFNVAELEGGRIFSWGLNSNLCTSGVNGPDIAKRIAKSEFVPGGQLGRFIGDLVGDVPSEVMRVLRCASVSCGASHCFVVSEDGTFGWGCNEERQLGTASDEPYTVLPVPFALPRNYPIRMVACGTHHSVAVAADGTVWAWGMNRNGELGRSLPALSAVPLEVEGLPRITRVVCGQAHTMALSADSSLVTWGSNQYGELGRRDGSYLPKLVELEHGADEDEQPMHIAANGFSSGFCSKSGRLFVWGFFKGPSFLMHQSQPRALDYPDLYVASFAMGLTHLAMVCDEALRAVLQLVASTDGDPADERYDEILALLARARGDVLHSVQNRAMNALPAAVPRVHCNVAYLVTNTQMLIVNFSQVLVTGVWSKPVLVRVSVPRPSDIPAGCVVKLEPLEFRLNPGESVTLNMTINTSKAVTENVSALILLTVTSEPRKWRLRLQRGPAGRQSKYYLVAAFPFTAMLNGRLTDQSAYLMSRACAEGDINTIKNLLNARDTDSANLLNTRDYEGRSPLFVAALAGHARVVKLLVARGADPNAPDSQGLTPLSVADSNGHHDVVQFLLSVGATLDARREGTSAEELAFLRAANKLYIGARKQDLTALDEEDLLSLQATLLRKLKALSLDMHGADAYAPEALAKSPSPAPAHGVVTHAPPPECVRHWREDTAAWVATGMRWYLRPTDGDWAPRLEACSQAAARLHGCSAW